MLHGDHGVGDFDAEAEEFVEVLHLLVEVAARADGLVLRLGGAIAEQVDGGLDLAAFALLRDGDENLPHILLGLEVLLAVALLGDDAHEVPADEILEVRVGIAAADLQLFHDLVSTHRLWSGHEQGVNLGHRAIDAPLRAERTPLGHELFACLFPGWFLAAHIFIKN